MSDIAISSKEKWEKVADWWFEETKNGDLYQNTIVVPYLDQLLEIRKSEKVLDIACGGGFYSIKMAGAGANVTAFDFCEKLINKAKEQTKEKKLPGRIDYLVIDACDPVQLSQIDDNAYDAALCTMGLHDMYDIEPLAKKLHNALKPDGRFVFAIPHPCFNGDAIIKKNAIEVNSYNTTKAEAGIAKPGQPSEHIMWSRSISSTLTPFFNAGFILDKIVEPVFTKETIDRFPKIWLEIPPAFIARLRKK